LREDAPDHPGRHAYTVYSHRHFFGTHVVFHTTPQCRVNLTLEMGWSPTIFIPIPRHYRLFVLKTQSINLHYERARRFIAPDHANHECEVVRGFDPALCCGRCSQRSAAYERAEKNSANS
jgi:hypothetical protein